MNIIDIEDQFSKCASIGSGLIVDGNMPGLPRLSIMIPTYRRPDFLKEAIRSVLNQDTDVLYEIVVVDNDATMSERVDEVVREFNDDRIRLFRNIENIGMFGNWNRCIELARGEWVSILNDDDLLHENFVKEIFSVVMQDKSINLLYSRATFMDARGSSLTRLKSQIKQCLKKVKGSLFSRNVDYIHTSDVYLDSPCSSLGMIFKRGHAMELGGYKSEAFPSADYVFFVMYYLRFGACRLNKCLAYYRIHENETANPITGKGFIEKDMKLRAALERYVAAPVSLLRLYAKLCALKTARQYKTFWGVDLNIQRIQQEQGLIGFPVMFSFRVVRFTLRAWFLLANIFKLNKNV